MIPDVSSTAPKSVLYISGRGGDHTKGLGGYIGTLAPHYDGISVNPEFLRQSIDEQIEAVRESLRGCNGGTVVANSFGAHLLLLALIEFEHDIQQIILLSPVLGAALSKERMFFSRPPATKRLMQAVEERRLALPTNSSIYIGSEDEGYCPILTSKYSDLIGEDRVFVLTGERHNLSKEIVQMILTKRLVNS